MAKLIIANSKKLELEAHTSVESTTDISIINNNNDFEISFDTDIGIIRILLNATDLNILKNRVLL